MKNKSVLLIPLHGKKSMIMNA